MERGVAKPIFVVDIGPTIQKESYAIVRSRSLDDGAMQRSSAIVVFAIGFG